MPGRFRIPVKAGFRTTDAIHQRSSVGYDKDSGADFIIEKGKP